MLSKDYTVIQSSDAFVVQYRKWLDLVGKGMPWFIGWNKVKTDGETSKRNAGEVAPSLNRFHRSTKETRFERHVIHSPSTFRAYRNVVKSKKAAGIFGFFVGVLAFISGSRRTTLFSAFCFGVRYMLSLLEKEFFTSYDRKLDLRYDKI